MLWKYLFVILLYHYTICQIIVYVVSLCFAESVIAVRIPIRIVKSHDFAISLTPNDPDREYPE